MNEYRMAHFYSPSGVVSYALNLVIYALDLVIYALEPVNHALHLVALRGSGSFPQLEPLDGFSRLWIK